MNWIEIDKQLQDEGWQLTLIRHGPDWRCHYSHVAHLPEAAHGTDMEMVIEQVQSLIRGG